MEEQLTKKERKLLKRREKIEAKEKSDRVRLAKRTAIWASALVLVAGAIFGAVKLGTAPSGQTALLIDAVSPQDVTKGNKDAKIILIEYSDFQCPACRSYHPLVKKLTEEFGDKMQFVYRHFPLPSHKNAELAARFAETAGRQGKFWEMHDLIFEYQSEWSGQSQSGARSSFKKYVESLGMNMEQFENDLDSHEIKDKVENDRQSGLRSDVNATPTFFLNGKQMENPRGYEQFRDIISAAAAQNQ